MKQMADQRTFVAGTDALKPGAALAIFERLVGRSTTPAERAEYERHIAQSAQPEAS
jgi:hypothetical protein